MRESEWTSVSENCTLPATNLGIIDTGRICVRPTLLPIDIVLAELPPNHSKAKGQWYLASTVPWVF